jgi:hypothetical protein
MRQYMIGENILTVIMGGLLFCLKTGESMSRIKTPTGVTPWEAQKKKNLKLRRTTSEKSEKGY